MYQQVNGVSTGSPLGPTLINIFVVAQKMPDCLNQEPVAVATTPVKHPRLMFRQLKLVLSMIMRRSPERAYSMGMQQSKRIRQQPPHIQPQEVTALQKPSQNTGTTTQGSSTSSFVSFHIRPSFRYYHSRHETCTSAWKPPEMPNQPISYRHERYLHSSSDDFHLQLAAGKDTNDPTSHAHEAQSGKDYRWKHGSDNEKGHFDTQQPYKPISDQSEGQYNFINNTEEPEEVSWTPHFVSAEQLGRKWVSVPTSNKTKNNGFAFSVLSYNLLADKLLYDNMFLYRKCKDYNHMDWDYRKHNLLKEIISYNADILCLQEVQAEHFYDWFNIELERRGYKSLYKRRSGNKPDGCAIFFRSSKFKAVHSHSMEFTRPFVPLMDRNNVAAMVVLEPRSKLHSTVPICVATTHLLFNKKRGDIKLAQLAYLLAELDKYARFSQHRGKLSHRGRNSKNGCYMPIILCGDFNSLPFSPLYDLITNGRLKYEGRSRIQISGQTSADSTQGSIFGKSLLPPQLCLSHACKWKPLEVITIPDDTPISRQPSEKKTHGTSDCIIIDPPPAPVPVRSKSQSEKTCQGFNARVTSSAKYHQNCADFSATEVQQPTTQEFLQISTGHATKQMNTDAQQHEQNNKLSNQSTLTTTPSQSHTNEDASEEEPGVLKHALNFKSVHSHMFPDGSREVTTCHSFSAFAVDYIFYSQPAWPISRATSSSVDPTSVDCLELTGYLSLFKKQQLKSLGDLPNRYLSSDHVALLAAFNLK